MWVAIFVTLLVAEEVGSALLEESSCPDLATALGGTASKLRVSVTAPSQSRRAVDKPGQEVAGQPNSTKTGPFGKHEPVVRDERRAKLAMEPAEIRADHGVLLKI